MGKLGINIGINVKEIDKERLKHNNGKVWMNLTTFIDPSNPDKYGQHGFISQSTDKEERENGVKTPILGNCQVFFTEGGAEPISDNKTEEEQIPF